MWFDDNFCVTNVSWKKVHSKKNIEIKQMLQIQARYSFVCRIILFLWYELSQNTFLAKIIISTDTISLKSVRFIYIYRIIDFFKLFWFKNLHGIKIAQNWFAQKYLIYTIIHFLKSLRIFLLFLSTINRVFSFGKFRYIYQSDFSTENRRHFHSSQGRSSDDKS